MAQIDGGEMIVRVFEQQGIREVFTLHVGARAEAQVRRGLGRRHNAVTGAASDFCRFFRIKN